MESQTIKTKERLCLGTIGLIVAFWKFDFLKLVYLLSESQISVLKDFKFLQGNYQPKVGRNTLLFKKKSS